VYGDENNVPADVSSGVQGPQTLFNRLEAQKDRALNRARLGRYLSGCRQHDSFWQPSGRFANGAPDDQVIGALASCLRIGHSLHLLRDEKVSPVKAGQQDPGGIVRQVNAE